LNVLRKKEQDLSTRYMIIVSETNDTLSEFHALYYKANEIPTFAVIQNDYARKLAIEAYCLHVGVETFDEATADIVVCNTFEAEGDEK
jgi:nitrite reductase/ring-hydroxylating ferredoxin subunit